MGSVVDTVFLLVLRFPLPLPLFLPVALMGDSLVGLGFRTVVSVPLAEVVSRGGRPHVVLSGLLVRWLLG